MVSFRHDRRGALLRSLVLAVVALAALVFVDCFNASGSLGWSDLGRAPHLAATTARPSVSRNSGAESPMQAVLTRQPGVVGAALVTLLVWLAVAIRANHVASRRRSRSPPEVVRLSRPI
jgi:hypothetical protein